MRQIKIWVERGNLSEEEWKHRIASVSDYFGQKIDGEVPAFLVRSSDAAGNGPADVYPSVEQDGADDWVWDECEHAKSRAEQEWAGVLRSVSRLDSLRDALDAYAGDLLSRESSSHSHSTLIEAAEAVTLFLREN
jgi:hypothetical protein